MDDAAAVSRIRQNAVNTELRWLEPRFAQLTAGVLVVILYGSLYPFQFHDKGLSLRTVLSIAESGITRLDILANVLLYWPLGVCLALTLPRVGLTSRIGLTGLCGAVLSVGIEGAQVRDFGRVASLVDAIANTGGAILGGLTAAVIAGPWRAPLLEAVRRQPFASLMLACWLGGQLFPYSVSPGWALWAGEISLLDLCQRCVVWLAVALLTEALVGTGRSRPAFGWIAMLVILAQVVIAGTGFPREQLWGAVLALLIWSLWLWRLPGRGWGIAVLFAIHVGVDAMRPFQFLTQPRRFGFIPFYSFIMASRDVAVHAFFDKAFLYGTLVWVLVRAGMKCQRATALAAGIVLALRIAQTYLPGRSAEITDAIMVLGLAAVMKLLAEGGSADDAQSLGDATKRYPIPRTVTR